VLGSRYADRGYVRVIQAIITDIGFLGAGSILKLSEEPNIQGLTTAAGIWMTSAIGWLLGLAAWVWRYSVRCSL
jgi:uncharacterized membrane protein YhiD involved in acid resistance